MLVVRNCFVAKAGQAGALAAKLKDAAASTGVPNYRVLTDMTGEFNRVIFEYEAGSLGEFEARMQEYLSGGPFREKMKGYTDLYLTGYRELLRVVD